MANNTTIKVGGTGKLSSDHARPGEPQRILIDVAAAVKRGGALASGDTIAVVDIPANTKVVIHRVYNYTLLNLGTSGAYSVGDAGSATRYTASTSTLTAGTDTAIASGMNTSGFIYTTAGQIRVAITNAGGTITDGKLWIVYTAFDVSAPTVLPVAFV